MFFLYLIFAKRAKTMSLLFHRNERRNESVFKSSQVVFINIEHKKQY